MVRGAEHLGERLGHPVRRHGDLDLVVGHVTTEHGARCVQAAKLCALADQAHVAIGLGLGRSVDLLDPFNDLEVGDTADVERDPSQLIGFPFGDAGGTCVPLANGATDAGLDVAPALKIGQLGRELSPTKALVADLEGARRRS